MNRRTVLAGTGIALSSALAGCLSEDEDESGSTDEANGSSDDTPTDTQSNESDAPPVLDADVEVYIATYTPEQATVLDAKEDEISENTHLDTVLSEASKEYDEGMEDDLEKDDHLSEDAKLAKEYITTDEMQEIENLLDREREDSGHTWFVEYKSTIFVVRTNAPPA